MIKKVLPFTRVILDAPWGSNMSFREKRVFVLRMRVAKARATVDRCIKEIQALEKIREESTEKLKVQALDKRARARAGLEKINNREESTERLKVRALDERLGKLRTDAGVAESRIVLLKGKQRAMGMPRREGLWFDLVRGVEKFMASEEGSARVLQKQLEEADDLLGVYSLLREDTLSLLRLGSKPSLVRGYVSLSKAERLIPHTAAIASRIAKLEVYAPGILVAVDGYLEVIEPHLDDILLRFDTFEQHVPFVLDNLDVLAPHIGSLMPHIDSLLLFADDGGKYLDILLPYVPRFAPLLDDLACHLVLLRPHMRKILPHFPVIAPSAYNFKDQLGVSENADILVFYFGWILRIPRLGRAVLGLPFMPRLAAFLGRKLPKWPVRRGTSRVVCNFEGCEIYA